ncbi:hypothetical protein [Klebsiella pneumoniae]|uniref:hypothetical protein n=1 Tax=Klebsiella pneumoniae TaxID=573 RepID=UPI001E5E233B|nr:hypothetical protein [Klebsiella pneumoniae]
MVSGHGILIVEGVENPIELRQGDGFLVKPETLFSLVDNPSTPTQWCEDIFAECSGNSLSFGGDGEVAVSVQREPSGHNLKHPTKWCPPNK